MSDNWATEGTYPRFRSWPSRGGLISRVGDPLQIRCDGFTSSARRKYEPSVIRLSRPSRVARFIDHEITAVTLDDALKALDGVEQPNELLARFSPGEMNAARLQAG